MPEFLRNSDAFVWSIERDPRLRSTIVSLILLDRSPDWSEVGRRFETLTRVVPKFSQRLASSPFPLPPRWENDPDFDLSFHLRRVAAPHDGDLDAVLEMVRVAAMADFDRARPLWEATLVDGMADGSAALLCKLHHSLTDGIGAVEMSRILFDLGEGQRDGQRDTAETPMSAGPIAVVRDAAVIGAKAAVSALTPLPRMLRDAVTNPVATVTDAVSTAGSVYRTMRPIAQPGSPIARHRTGIRRVGVIEVPMSTLHRAGSAAGGTLNDAFIAAVAAGLSRYHGKRGVKADHFVVCMPISIRTAQDPIGGNRATLMRFDVPAGDVDPAERIRRIHRQTTQARSEKSLAHTPFIAGVLNAMPRGYVSSVLRSVDFVASDVPGFSEPLRLAGAEVKLPIAFSPTIGAALNATLLSYVDTCAVGINVDTGAFPDFDVLSDCLNAGFREVLTLAADA
ncbi:diacylglycerol O-acyltransferase [Mycolicibacterium agri]|uniref:diacylglycerol O-acyltransferase n=1 Tax=Mycolicibacterium agri TaxID=36811 RepID=A0A2A7MTL3_MYCAG|nr:wax ester/triacylglycerol synthase domain-containing protein [Mycolicibacterium agri]PEG34833.1 diacylglycerol O-acyltransferase [Mycolicibacterium agri]GFG50318.1 diacylglycerol O-acyltransferase [Mycolicibacterium agri]